MLGISDSRPPARRAGGDCAVSGLGERAAGAGDPGEAEGDRAAQRAEAGHHPPRRHPRPRPLRPPQTLRHPLARRHSAALGGAAAEARCSRRATAATPLGESAYCDDGTFPGCNVETSTMARSTSADAVRTQHAMLETSSRREGLPAGDVLVAMYGGTTRRQRRRSSARLTGHDRISTSRSSGRRSRVCSSLFITCAHCSYSDSSSCMTRNDSAAQAPSIIGEASKRVHRCCPPLHEQERIVEQSESRLARLQQSPSPASNARSNSSANTAPASSPMW